MLMHGCAAVTPVRSILRATSLRTRDSEGLHCQCVQAAGRNVGGLPPPTRRTRTTQASSPLRAAVATRRAPWARTSDEAPARSATSTLPASTPAAPHTARACQLADSMPRQPAHCRCLRTVAALRKHTRAALCEQRPLRATPADHAAVRGEHHASALCACRRSRRSSTGWTTGHVAAEHGQRLAMLCRRRTHLCMSSSRVCGSESPFLLRANAI